MDVADNAVLANSSVHRKLEFDAIKCIAIFLIVLVHVSGVGFSVVDSKWWVSVFWGSLGRDGVPLFFMASGALLLNRETNPREIGRRIWRISVPFWAWSVIYLWYYAAHGQGVKGWIPYILRQGAAGHMWFLYTMIGAYLAMPIMVTFNRHASKENKVMVLGVWFFGASIVPTITAFKGSWLSIDFSFIPIYTGYFLLGSFLADGRMNAQAKIIAASFFIAGWSTTAIGTYELALARGVPAESLYLYSSPAVVVSSAGLFSLIRAMFATSQANHPMRGTCLAIAQTSFGIYLSHLLILRFMLDRGVPANLTSGFFGFPLMTLLVLVLSYAFVAIIQQVPILRTICPR